MGEGLPLRAPVRGRGLGSAAPSQLRPERCRARAGPTGVGSLASRGAVRSPGWAARAGVGARVLCLFRVFGIVQGDFVHRGAPPIAGV